MESKTNKFDFNDISASQKKEVELLRPNLMLIEDLSPEDYELKIQEKDSAELSEEEPMSSSTAPNTGTVQETEIKVNPSNQL